MPALTDQDFFNAVSGQQQPQQQPQQTDPVSDDSFYNALEGPRGTVSPGLSQFNAFMRGIHLAAPDTIRALGSNLEQFYDSVTGTGSHFSDRNPEQLLASIQEARYKLTDLRSQFDALPPTPIRGVIRGETEYNKADLQAKMAAVNADIEGMSHQYALKTGTAKPGVADNIGSAVKGFNDFMTARTDEARGLKPPSLDTNPNALVSGAVGRIPILGPLLGADVPPPNLAEQADPSVQFFGGLGQQVGSLPLFASGNLPLEFSTIMLQRSQAARDEARLNGADLAGQDRASTIGLLAGAAEAPFYRMVFGKFLGHERPLTVGELGLKMAKNLGAGAGMGAEQQAASNMIAVASGYDPNRKLTDGLVDSILQQSAMMGVAGGLVDAPSFLLNRFQKPVIDLYRKPGQEPTETPEPGRVTPPAQIPATAVTSAAPVTPEQLAEQLARAATPAAEPAYAASKILPGGETPRERKVVDNLLAVNALDDTPENRARLLQSIRNPPEDVTFEAGVAAPPPEPVEISPEERARRREGNIWTAERRIGEAEPGAAPEAPQLEPRPEVPGAFAAAARAVQEVAERYRHAEVPEGELRDQLADLRDRLGPRVGFRIMSPDQLPSRYRLALAQQGINPTQYAAFYDKGWNEFFINPQGFDSRAQLNDAIIRKFIVNGLADRASIHPLLSYRDAAESPGIAQLLTDNPDADRTTAGAYDKTSGNVYLNVPRLLAGPDPTGEALRTAVHETAGHQGIRTWFKTDFPAYDAFLDRVYNGMTRSGAGDRIAARFGMNMGQLADHYGYDTNTPLGQRQLAEELLARYSEQFDPTELAQPGTPKVIQSAVDLIRRGFAGKQGLTFGEGDALNFLKGAWRYTDPELALKTTIRPGEAIRPAQKRIGEYGETTLVDAASDALNRAETLDAARASSRGPISNEEPRGTPGKVNSIVAAGGKLLRGAETDPAWLDPAFVEGLKFRQLSNPTVNAEHNTWLTQHGYVLKETRPDGPIGPYGLLPALPGRTVKPGEAYYSQPSEYYGVTGASPSQYHSSYDLRNEIFPNFQTHFEGYTAYDGDNVARIVTSQPFLDETIFQPSGEAQRNVLMAARGFMPIDHSTYYNRDRGIVAMDLHDANVLVNKDNPNDFRVMDGTFARVHGQLANHFDQLLDNNTYEQFNVERAEAEIERRNRAMMLGAEPEEYEEELRAWQEEQAAQDRGAAARDETVAIERDNPPPAAGPEEADLARLTDLLARKTDEPIPQEVLDQIKATLAQQQPTQRIRMSAMKGTLIPDDPATVRAARAAPDQLLVDRVSRPYWQGKANEIYSQHLGNTDAIMSDFLSGRISREYGEDVAATVYKNLTHDIRMERGSSTDPVRRQQLDQVQTQLNKAFDERGTIWAREGSARNDAWYGAEGILAKYRGQLAADQEKYLRRDGNFANAVRRVRGLLDGVNQDVSNRLKDLFLTADKANVDNSWKPLPVQYADWVAKNIAEQARRAGMPADQVPALEELFGRFRSTITQLAKENGIQMNRPARERMSATDRIKEGLDNWDWMSRTLKETVAQAQKTFADAPEDSEATLAYKQRMRDAFTALGQQADVPFTDTQLARFLPERQVRIADLVNQHRSRIAATMDSLADYLTRNSNLNPAQAQLVQNAVASHVGQAIDVRRQAEFDRIIRDSAGKRYDPTKAGVSMQRFINLINMGAFDDSAVADALAPSFGYTSYDPEFAAQLRELGDKLEMYKDQGRKGFQTEQIKLDMLNALNDWRAQNLGWWQKARDGAQNIFLGNILTGIPTHVIASMSDFFNGSNSVAGFLARLPNMEARAAAFPRVLKYMWEGFTGEGGGLDRFAHIMRTGVDPNQEISIRDIMENAGEAGNVGGPQTNMKGWLAPYKYVFRGITALHALMRNGFEEPIEWLYGFDQLARQPGMTLEQALDQADEIYHGNAGKIQAAEQTARSEGLSGQQYRLRVQEQLDQNRPDMMRQVGQIFGARTIYTQAPEGFLGVGARAVQQAARQMPALRYLVPFTNIVANVLDNSINFSPLGFIRFHPDIAEGYFRDVLNRTVPKEGEMLKAEELNLLRQDLLTKATLGTLGLAGMGAIAAIPGPGGQPLIQIHGSGPTDAKKRYQLMDAGWTPNSISFNLGGHPIYVPFEALPIAFGLQILGNWSDANLYENKMNALQKASYLASQTGAGIIDRSFLRGIKELFDSFAGQADPRGGAQAMMRLLQNNVASSIPYAGSALVRQLHNEMLDPKLYEGGVPGVADVLRDVPFMNWIDGSKPRLNILGEPITSYPAKRMIQAGSVDPIWRFIGDNNMFLPDPRTPKILGQNMDETQKYNFTKYHGAYLKELLGDNLQALSAPDLDPEIRQKMIEKFSQLATKRAKADVIGGRND